MIGLRSWQALVGLIAVVAAAITPLAADGDPLRLIDLGPLSAGLLVFMLVAVAVAAEPWRTHFSDGFVVFLAAHLGAWQALEVLPMVEGDAGWGFWALVVASWLLAWRLVTILSAARTTSRILSVILKVLVPFLFGAWLLFLWEVIVRGAGVPPVLLPAPSAVWAKILVAPHILWADFRQTFLKAVLAGYLIGCLTGFLVAILADRVPFLKRGLLPVGNLVSALPIIGMAPIMVMWFGFDWQSKAAVVVIMTFFPMLVNTVAGLAAADAMQKDLMRTYAADYGQTLVKLRLPAALPFIFNALKINSTLALIAAIVAEFFGTPTVGMGFRISTEVGRLAIDMVWAEIAVAALAGSVFYGVLALIERAVTFWHPSFRT
jgi:NitT/TauT family transport system permease protein